MGLYIDCIVSRTNSHIIHSSKCSNFLLSSYKLATAFVFCLACCAVWSLNACLMHIYIYIYIYYTVCIASEVHFWCRKTEIVFACKMYSNNNTTSKKFQCSCMFICIKLLAITKLQSMSLLQHVMDELFQTVLILTLTDVFFWVRFHAQLKLVLLSLS